ncbi:serine protease family S54 [Thraustotheca clavata]|uniref:Serine protease family S54 n=1 Tax=Thraustotheca clavata TaxID=74557 RepID=A0A1V9Y7I1_9STRA|nr:serine protease family S54 [Thraustotheca clavata]
MLSRLVRLERSPKQISSAQSIFRSSIKVKAIRHTIARVAPKQRSVQADTSVLGFGFLGLGIASSNIKDVQKMNVFEFLEDSVHLVAGKMRQAYYDENRRILVLLIATNSIVFGMWNISHRSPRLAQFMWNNFACSFQGVSHERRWHTLLTSAFSHITLTHFGVNMFMLWHFGSSILPPAEESDRIARRYALNSPNGSWFESISRPFGYHPPRSLTAREFCQLYFSSAIASSVISAVVSGARGSRYLYSIGASGAVFGILTSYCLMRPDQQLYLYGMLPLTADDLLKVSFLVNGVGSIFQHARHAPFIKVAPTIDFVGHLGGQAAAYQLTPK